MAKATFKSKSGTIITVEGNEREVSKIVAVVEAPWRGSKSKTPVPQILGGS